MLEALQKDGVIVHTNITTELVALEGAGAGEECPRYCAPWGTYRATVKDTKTGEITTYETAALLNCTGRTPNVTDCGLDNVGVEWDNRQGVTIDDYFATTNPHIYSCGDCASPYKFTHAADFQARYAVRNMFLGKSERQSDLLIPWCTYTSRRWRTWASTRASSIGGGAIRGTEATSLTWTDVSATACRGGEDVSSRWGEHTGPLLCECR